jgi:hypothetical protein
LRPAVPILFVRDVSASAVFFKEKLGFEIDFLYGDTPQQGSMRRERAVSERGADAHAPE